MQIFRMNYSFFISANIHLKTTTNWRTTVHFTRAQNILLELSLRYLVRSSQALERWFARLENCALNHAWRSVLRIFCSPVSWTAVLQLVMVFKWIFALMKNEWFILNVCILMYLLLFYSNFKVLGISFKALYFIKK